MRVKMIVQLSGTRDGKPWPGRGETMDLPDEEAAQMCASGMAETVKGEPEKAVPKKAEAAETPEPEVTDPPAPEKRGPGRPRKSTQ